MENYSKMKTPTMGKDVFIAPGAAVLGDVVLGDRVNIWFNAVIRADQSKISIGADTNIQDNCVIHVETDADVMIGNGVSIGHGAIVHGCTIGDHTLIGMGAIILNHALIGKNCIIGAGALVTEGTIIPDNSVVIGQPGRVVRQITPEESAENAKNAAHYMEIAAFYMKEKDS